MQMADNGDPNQKRPKKKSGASSYGAAADPALMNGSSCRSGKKRPPQRGLGVAQLEKIRCMEELLLLQQQHHHHSLRRGHFHRHSHVATPYTYNSCFSPPPAAPAVIDPILMPTQSSAAALMPPSMVTMDAPFPICMCIHHQQHHNHMHRLCNDLLQHHHRSSSSYVANLSSASAPAPPPVPSLTHSRPLADAPPPPFPTLTFSSSSTAAAPPQTFTHSATPPPHSLLNTLKLNLDSPGSPDDSQTLKHSPAAPPPPPNLHLVSAASSPSQALNRSSAAPAPSSQTLYLNPASASLPLRTPNHCSAHPRASQTLNLNPASISCTSGHQPECLAPPPDPNYTYTPSSNHHLVNFANPNPPFLRRHVSSSPNPNPTAPGSVAATATTDLKNPTSSDQRLLHLNFDSAKWIHGDSADSVLNSLQVSKAADQIPNSNSCCSSISSAMNHGHGAAAAVLRTSRASAAAVSIDDEEKVATAMAVISRTVDFSHGQLQLHRLRSAMDPAPASTLRLATSDRQHHLSNQFLQQQRSDHYSGNWKSSRNSQQQQQLLHISSSGTDHMAFHEFFPPALQVINLRDGDAEGDGEKPNYMDNNCDAVSNRTENSCRSYSCSSPHLATCPCPENLSLTLAINVGLHPPPPQLVCSQQPSNYQLNSKKHHLAIAAALATTSNSAAPPAAAAGHGALDLTLKLSLQR